MTLADLAVVPEEAPQFFAGFLLLTLAIVVLKVSFASRLNRAFALYLVVVGFGHVWGAWDDTPALRPLAFALVPYFYLAGPFALTWLALRYREQAGGIRTPTWVGWTLLAGVVTILGAYVMDPALYRIGGDGVQGPLFVLSSWNGFGALLSATLAFVFARSAARATPAQRTGYALAALAFGVEVAYLSARQSMTLLADPTAFGNAWGLLAASLRLGALPVVAGAVVLLARGRARAAASVLSLAAASSVVPIAFAAMSPAGNSAAGNIVGGLWQLAAPLLLGYAVVRHQLLGIDVKVRWTISKSTVAAVFIAVFFIASEAAQQFFGDTLGSTYVGIAAAGALVFTMAPLQRAAERLAERAVPIAAAAAKGGSDEPRASREERYRVVLRRFLADRTLTREEERTLAHLAADLGIDAGRAYTLREEVTDESAGGARA